MICTVDGCDTEIICKGLCWKHYARKRRTGTTDRESLPTECSIDGCYKERRARGWCGMHYHRWLIHGDPMTHLYADRRNGVSR